MSSSRHSSFRRKKASPTDRARPFAIVLRTKGMDVHARRSLIPNASRRWATAFRFPAGVKRRLQRCFKSLDSDKPSACAWSGQRRSRQTGSRSRGILITRIVDCANSPSFEYLATTLGMWPKQIRKNLAFESQSSYPAPLYSGVEPWRYFKPRRSVLLRTNQARLAVPAAESSTL
jgi:hypothetical protein